MNRIGAASPEISSLFTVHRLLFTQSPSRLRSELLVRRRDRPAAACRNEHVGFVGSHMHLAHQQRVDGRDHEQGQKCTDDQAADNDPADGLAGFRSGAMRERKRNRAKHHRAGGHGIYNISFYFGTIILIPAVALGKISSTFIADAWKDKDMETINDIYYKSSINQLFASIMARGSLQLMS